VESDFGVTWPKGASAWQIVVAGGKVAGHNPSKARRRACISTVFHVLPHQTSARVLGHAQPSGPALLAFGPRVIAVVARIQFRTA